jgi:2-polyprenyl-3-methyl-5-hydroxy-6-metoxy-1,4-benzoquinol methylase
MTPGPEVTLAGRRRGYSTSQWALASSLSRRSRGSTLVVEPDGADCAHAMRAHRLDVLPVTLDAFAALDPPGPTARTVALVDVLSRLEHEEARPVVEQAWRLLEPGGRLLLAVENPEAARDEQAVRWTPRKLRRLLRDFGRPRLATDQPYRWLAMEVRKPREGARCLSRTVRLRYRVTADLCKGRVIELGCGAGLLAGVIASRGHDVVGVDMNVEKIEAARRAYPALEFLACDASRLPLPDATFDTAVLAEILEHVDDRVGSLLLATAWRLVRPGGRLIVSVPNEDCIPHRNHIRVFDRRSLRALLRPLGRPQCVTEQPYKWLLAYVDRGVS